MNNMIQVVVGVIERDGEIIVGKKIPKPGHEFDNLWHIPGGKVEGEESLEDAVRREMLQETGLDVQVIRKLRDVERHDAGVVVSWFHCVSEEGEPCAGDDLQEVMFVAKARAPEVCSPVAQESWPEEFKEYLNC